MVSSDETDAKRWSVVARNFLLGFDHSYPLNKTRLAWGDPAEWIKLKLFLESKISSQPTENHLKELMQTVQFILELCDRGYLINYDLITAYTVHMLGMDRKTGLTLVAARLTQELVVRQARLNLLKQEQNPKLFQSFASEFEATQDMILTAIECTPISLELAEKLRETLQQEKQYIALRRTTDFAFHTSRTWSEILSAVHQYRSYLESHVALILTSHKEEISEGTVIAELLSILNFLKTDALESSKDQLKIALSGTDHPVIAVNNFLNLTQPERLCQIEYWKVLPQSLFLAVSRVLLTDISDSIDRF